MPATIDQDLLPNAVAEFHTAKDHGHSDGEAWIATVARIRFDVLQMAIAALTIANPSEEDPDSATCKRCIDRLVELQGDYAGEPKTTN